MQQYEAGAQIVHLMLHLNIQKRKRVSVDLPLVEAVPAHILFLCDLFDSPGVIGGIFS